FTANAVGRIKVHPVPELSYCRQVACPDSVPAGPPGPTQTAQRRRAPRCSSRTAVTLRLRHRLRAQVVSARVLVGRRTLRRLGRGTTAAEVDVRRRGGPTVV